MQGESEFTFGGALKGWRIVERNAAIAVPTLVLAGEFDTMSIECHQQVGYMLYAYAYILYALSDGLAGLSALGNSRDIHSQVVSLLPAYFSYSTGRRLLTYPLTYPLITTLHPISTGGRLHPHRVAARAHTARRACQGGGRAAARRRGGRQVPAHVRADARHRALLSAPLQILHPVTPLRASAAIAAHAHGDRSVLRFKLTEYVPGFASSCGVEVRGACFFSTITLSVGLSCLSVIDRVSI